MPPLGNAESNTGIYFNSGGRFAQQTPSSSQRQPLARQGDSSINRSHMGGYGVNAGMRVGGQPEGKKPSYAFHPYIESLHIMCPCWEPSSAQKTAPHGTDPRDNQGQERPRIIHPLAQTPQQPQQPSDCFYWLYISYPSPTQPTYCWPGLLKSCCPTLAPHCVVLGT